MRTKVIAFAVATLFAGAAFAQTSSGTNDQSESRSAARGVSADAAANAIADMEARDRAKRAAESAGMQDVQVLDRVFVVQGTTTSGETVFMMVTPSGLIGVGRPVATQSSDAGGKSTERVGAASASTSGSREFQIGEIDPGDPFGDINTSKVTGVEESEIADFAATLTEQNLAEMKERCDVISGDPSTYGKDVTTLCSSFMKWWSSNR